MKNRNSKLNKKAKYNLKIWTGFRLRDSDKFYSKKYSWEYTQKENADW